MPGSLVIPNIIANEPGPTAQVSKLDTNWTAIQTYVNDRQIAFGTFAARPAAGKDGRWYFATDTGVLYADTGAAWTQVALGTLASNLAETFTGLRVSNSAGDPVNDLDIAVGACSSDDAVIANRVIMSLTSGLTKQLDVPWAVGTNQGGRMSAAAIADTTYHLFLIERVDTGVVDAGYDVSPTAPTLPANYSKARRIFSFRRVGGAIQLFSQNGDEVLLLTPVLDIDVLNAGVAAVTRVLASVPTGVIMDAQITLHTVPVATNFVTYVSPLAVNDQAPSTTLAPLASLGFSAAVGEDYRPMTVRTDAANSIRTRQSLSGAGDIQQILVRGWTDRRGRG